MLEGLRDYQSIIGIPMRMPYLAHRASVRHQALLVLATLLTLLAVPLSPPSVTAQGDNVVRIISTDLSQFPTVTATVSASTATGEPLNVQQWVVDLNGTVIPKVEVATAKHPIAVALVVDLSARMSDQGTSGGSRFADMKPLLDTLVDQLAGGQHMASLITFRDTVQVGHALTNDLGAIRNTLNRSNTKLVFDPAGLETAEPTSPYPLVEALNAGLKQLASADNSQPLGLVLFAAGDPAPADLAALKASIAAYREKKRPVRVLVFSFGAKDAGTFKRFPANPDGLKQVASTLGGTFFPLGTQIPEVALRQQIDQAFTGLLQRSELTTLRFVAEHVPAGEAVLQVSANGASNKTTLSLNTIGPQFNVVVDSRSFQARVRVSIATKFTQAPIAQVAYLLNNYLITQPVTEGNDFGLDIDTYDPVFQGRFPPGEYQLNAVATDTSGNKAESQTQLTVTVFAPPSGVARWANAIWWLGPLVIIALIGAGSFFVWQRRRGSHGNDPRPPRQTDPIPVPPPIATSSDDWITGELGNTNQWDEDKPTAELPRNEDRPTAELPAHMLSHKRWFIEVVEGDDLILANGQTTRRAELKGVYVDIGRTERNTLRVAQHYEAISRRHVTIGLFVDKDYLELTDPESRHGTFIGDEQTPIPRGVAKRLQSGDTFSLARLLKLRVEME